MFVSLSFAHLPRPAPRSSRQQTRETATWVGYLYAEACQARLRLFSKSGGEAARDSAVRYFVLGARFWSLRESNDA
jgi:hypothetical protein